MLSELHQKPCPPNTSTHPDGRLNIIVGWTYNGLWRHPHNRFRGSPGVQFPRATRHHVALFVGTVMLRSADCSRLLVICGTRDRFLSNAVRMTASCAKPACTRTCTSLTGAHTPDMATDPKKRLSARSRRRSFPGISRSPVRCHRTALAHRQERHREPGHENVLSTPQCAPGQPPQRLTKNAGPSHHRGKGRS
jgi:hypothetical protein